MSNVLLSMGETRDLHNNTMDDLNLLHHVQNQNPRTAANQNQIVEEIAVKSTLGGLDAVAGEDEEGFKTPPLPQHRIPALKECPAAPRKPRNITPSWKKKKKKSELMMSPRLLLLDDSNEVEAMFPLAIRRNILYCKFRKVSDENSFCPLK